MSDIHCAERMMDRSNKACDYAAQVEDPDIKRHFANQANVAFGFAMVCEQIRHTGQYIVQAIENLHRG